MFHENSTTTFFRPNFINYAFKDDMISDGIENCIQYIKNFNPEKSSIHLHILLKLSTMLLLEEYRKRKNNCI